MATASLTHHYRTAIADAPSLAVDYFICSDRQTVIIASATTNGKLYAVTSTDCSCPAGLQELPCWHADARLMVLYPHKPGINAGMLEWRDALS